MRPSPLETYQSNGAEAPYMRKWIFRALILSVLFHLALIGFFRATKLERFIQTTERLVPRAFSVSRLNVNPELLKEQPDEEEASPKKTADTPQIDIPLDKPSADQSMDELRATPLAPPTEIAKPIVNETPRIDATNLQAMARLQESASKTLDKELNAATAQLLRDKPKSSRESLLKMADQADAQNAARAGKSGAGAVSGFSNLDDLLGQAGGLKPGTRPLNMPGGALFEYDAVEIKPDAANLMRKLGRLILNNPNVTFSTEGHTDTIGTPEYNAQLSRRRAEAVRDWLVQNMNINPDKIEVVGRGSSRTLAKPNEQFERLQALMRQQQAAGQVDPAVRAEFDRLLPGEIQRQGPNRRVEIVIKFR